MTGRLEGKVALITGAARGQGRAHAVAMAREGADIAGLDLAGPLPGVPYESPSPADLEETARLVQAEGRRMIARIGDVRDRDALEQLATEAVSELGGLDVVVANAGICIPAAWDQTTPEVFRDHLDINVTGVWNTVMAAAPHLVARGGGSVVVISSYAGKKVQPFMIHYTTSKHALVGMTRGFAAELGPHRIRVNSIHPGAVSSPMGSGDMVGAIERSSAANPALMQMGTPFLPRYAAECDEIAAAAVFLASDDAAFITSEHLSVDGGSQYF